MRRSARPLRHLSILFLVLGLALAACGNSGGGGVSDEERERIANSAPGVTDKEIRFAALGTNSNNPLGTCVLECYNHGVRAYFAYRNAEGGLFDRQLVLDDADVIDDQLGQNKQGALKIISDNKTFATFTAPQLATGWEDLNKNGVPTYGPPFYPGDMNNREAIFSGVGVTCISCTSRMNAYGAKLLNAKKVAAVGYGVSQSSKECVKSIVDTIKKYAPETGQELVYSNDNLAFGLANGIGPEVSEMKRSGVEAVITCIDVNGSKTLATELDRQGLTNVKLFLPNTYDAEFVKDNAALFEGDIATVAFAPFESNPAGTGLAEFLQWVPKSGGRLTDMAMYGWIAADLAYQGIKAAGEGFNRATVIAATNKFTDYNANGLVNPTDWSRQHVAPTEDDPTTNGPKLDCMAYVKIVKGAFQIVGGTKDKPFVCWSNANRDWSEPTPTSFAS